MSRLLILLLLGVTACVPVRRANAPDGSDDDDDDDDAATDSDGDELLDVFEDTIGTDPFDPDTDDDGFEDGAEHLSFFRPDDPSDWPYTGGYPRQPIPVTVASGTHQVGDVAPNFTLTDQHGQELQLHRFYGNVVMIRVDAGWCPPCIESADLAEEEYLSRKDQGFVILDLLMDGDTASSTPDPEGWAVDRGMTSPVFGDGGAVVSDPWFPGQAVPSFSILDRSLTIQSLDVAGSGAELWDLVDDLLAEPIPTVPWPLP